jgi:hypothetical protein
VSDSPLNSARLGFGYDAIGGGVSIPLSTASRTDLITSS